MPDPSGRNALLSALGAAPPTKLRQPALKPQTTQTPKWSGIMMPYAKAGALEPGNIDLSARPYVKNPDGSVSTIRSMGVNLGGKEYLIPTVSQDGRLMEPDEAIDEFYRTGEHLGVYSSPETSDAAGEALHLDQMAHPPRNTLLDAMYKQGKKR